MNDAGRIGFVIKGDYDSSVAYDFLDIVYFGSSSYVAKKFTIGNEPRDNNEYWQVLVKNSDSVVTGIKGNAETAYRTGNVSLSSGDIGALPKDGTAASASRLANASSIKTAMPGDNTMIYTSDINVSNVPGLFPTENNANAMLSLSRHPGKFYTQVGFSSNGNLYCRHANGADLTATIPWEQIAFITSNVASANTVNGHTVNADVPADAKFTDTTYGLASESTNGLMSSSDKKNITPVVLFSGTSSAGTLTQSIAGFSRIKIYGYQMQGDNYGYGCWEARNDKSSYVGVSCVLASGNYLISDVVGISGKSFDIESHYRLTIGSSSISAVSTTANKIVIERIEGYYS